MELRHLRYFLAVAQELNFTRAAASLNIAQPPLTQQIRALEAEMGVALVDRSAYRIALTEAGKVFAADVARILGDVRGAVLKAKRAAQGTVGNVRVGFTESASFNPLVPGTLHRFRAAYPDIAVSLEERQSTELATALREGRLDAAFVRPPLRASEGLTFMLLEEEDMVVALPAAHRLAGRKTLRLKDLASETFILYPRSARPGLADAIVTACERAGFVPKVEQYAPQLSSTVNLVAASLGISIVPKSMKRLQPQAVVYVPLRNEPLKALLGLAYRTGESSAATLQFIETAKAAPGGAAS